MHVPSQMAEHLLPQAPALNPAQAASSYSPLFKVPITLIDEMGQHWMVQYEGSSYRDQKHPRLTRGWRDFVRANNIEIGEYGVGLGGQTGAGWGWPRGLASMLGGGDGRWVGWAVLGLVGWVDNTG